MFENVNFVAVFFCGVASMIIGSLWYSKALFGNAWMQLSGISEKDIEAGKKEMPKTYGLMFVASLVMACVLAIFANYAGVADMRSGAVLGFWAWLGFVATVTFTGVLFERKPMNLYFIQAGYQLVTLVVMGAIIGFLG